MPLQTVRVVVGVMQRTYEGVVCGIARRLGLRGEADFMSVLRSVTLSRPSCTLRMNTGSLPFALLSSLLFLNCFPLPHHEWRLLVSSGLHSEVRKALNCFRDFDL
jgi:hypothetical protein